MPRPRWASPLVLVLAASCHGADEAPATDVAAAGAQRCGQLSGTVFLSSHLDKELPGVSVTFLQQGKVAFSGLTNAEGRFTTPCLPYGRYQFRLRKWLTAPDYSGLENMVDTIPPRRRAAKVAEGGGQQVVNRPADSPIYALIDDP